MFFTKDDIELTDGELIARYKSSGSLEDLSFLYSRYMHLVYGVCLKYLQDREMSKDAVMQIFEKLSSDLLKHDVDNFKSWLHVLTKNFCLMKIRTEKSKKEKEENIKKDSEIFMESAYELHHDNGQAVDADIEALTKCIEKLNEQQKMCVSMFYLDEKCYQEIADASGYELKRVKSYIQNGKRNLKICLEQRNVKRS